MSRSRSELVRRLIEHFGRAYCRLIRVPLRPSLACLMFSCLLLFQPVRAEWAHLDHVSVKQEITELAGPCTVITYDATDETISTATPIYVFVRYRPSPDSAWSGLSPETLTGNGIALVQTAGAKKIVWWGSQELGLARFQDAEFRVRGIRLCRVPGGRFTMKTIPGQGRDESNPRQPVLELPGFLIARDETTVGMFVDFLNETEPSGAGWNERMADPDRCGIERRDSRTYQVIQGRENFPVTYVSWYDAGAFARWCGLRLPTEAEFEKSIRGGIYLDGDSSKGRLNSLPERRYPWGNEKPGTGGRYRCNYDGTEDGFEFTAPVGSYSELPSPYGIADLVGNVAEWTSDWYSTSHHAGLDGYRVVRGGSWMDPEETCDAISGATQFPLDESSIIGFRVAVTEPGDR